MSLRLASILILLAAILGAVFTRYMFPKVETKTEVVEKEVTKNNVRTIIKEVVRKDGTKETTTEIVDKTVRKEDKNSTSLKITKKDWFVSITVNKPINDNDLMYQLSVSRRQIGPLFLTGNVSRFRDETVIGIGAGFEF